MESGTLERDSFSEEYAGEERWERIRISDFLCMLDIRTYSGSLEWPSNGPATPKSCPCPTFCVGSASTSMEASSSPSSGIGATRPARSL